LLSRIGQRDYKYVSPIQGGLKGILKRTIKPLKLTSSSKRRATTPVLAASNGATISRALIGSDVLIVMPGVAVISARDHHHQCHRHSVASRLLVKERENEVVSN
jgi:hypothetical protein